MYGYLNSSFQISDYHQYSHTECDYLSYKYHSPDATVPICVLLRRRKKKKKSLLGVRRENIIKGEGKAVFEIDTCVLGAVKMPADWYVE